MLKTISLLAALLLVTACATDKREIQHDPQDSDEMLKSPCACMPVPYEGPDFTWGRA